ncbi:MAG TPA: twin transmembrane helix small protein [Verrucomicrobiae bacterium]|nr:twin transmembrane helix small protein [Verrucomicrobiae bacterium]
MSLPKVILVALLLAIVASLFSGLFFLMKDESNKRRMLTALKVRVGLSIALLVFLALAFTNGWLEPHGLGK